MGRVPLRRVLRVTGFVLTALGLLIVVGAVAIALWAQGPRFGWLMTKLMPATAGQVTVGGGHMTLKAWTALLTGRPASIELDQVSVTDPEGTVVLSAGVISAEVEVHLGPPRVILHNLRFVDGGWRLAQMKSRRTLGFFAAFASPVAARAGRRPRAPGQGVLFEITRASLQRIDTVLDFPTWGLTLKNVETAGSLLIDARDPTRPVFGFDALDVDARGGGLLRVLRETRAIRLPFERAEIQRVAITSERRSEILLVVKEAMTGRSRLHGQATFSIAPPATGERPGLDVTAALDTPADALTAVAAHSDAAAWRPLRVEGAAGAITFQLKGPYDALRGALGVENLDVIYRERIFRRVRLKVDLSLRPLQVRLHDLAFGTPGAGRVNLNAELDAALNIDGDLRLHHVATDSYLPPALRPLAGGWLTGRVSARAGLGTGAAILRALDLTLTRPQRPGLPPVVPLRVRGGA
ncbi:MAG TPA: hypothetical protein VFH73_12175, partial [Polyangia bacterium]|nr:hypothetical protein [Polyangia bacterium]